MPKLWLKKLATTGDGGAGLLLELHCACAAAGAMTCANVTVPNVSRVFKPKRVGANRLRVMDLLSAAMSKLCRDLIR